MWSDGSGGGGDVFDCLRGREYEVGDHVLLSGKMH